MLRTLRLPVLLLFLLICAAPRPAPAATDDAEAALVKRLEEARRCAENRRKADEGLRLAEAIIADPKVEARHKVEAFEIVLKAHEVRRKHEDLIKAARRMAAAFPGDVGVGCRATVAAAEAFWAQRKRDDAVAEIHAFLAKHPADKAAAAARVRLGTFLLDLQKHDEAYEVCRKAVDAGLADDKQTAQMLQDMAEAMWRKGDLAKCEAAMARLVQPRYLQERASWERPRHVERYAEVLIKQKKYDQARKVYADAQKTIEDPRARQHYSLLTAETFRTQERRDEALKACERVFTDHGARSDYWYEAQQKIHQLHLAAGDFDAAVKAARICLDAAYDSTRLRGAVQMLAAALKGLDGHVGRANAFINYQKYGPAGADAKAGTADDLTDPLAKLGYPSCPQREKAFAEARKAAGDDAAAVLFCARTYTYTGRPKQALRLYVDAFRRCDRNELDRFGREMIVVGVRAVRGHAVGLAKFFEFVNYGPAGPDGKAKTADDLPDPFASLGLKLSQLIPPRPGGALELTADDIRALREAGKVLRGIAVAPLGHDGERSTALRAYVRVCEALGQWDRRDTREWFLARAGEAGNRRYASVWISAAAQAARARAIHLGSARAFWSGLDPNGLFADGEVPRDLDRSRKDFERRAAALLKTRSLVPSSERPWRLAAVKMHPDRLEPLPEPAKK